MHKPILLLFSALTLISSCQPKETPNPQESSQTDTTDTTDTEPIDSLSGGFNENVLSKQKHGGAIRESIMSNDGNILAVGTNVTGNPVIWKIAIANGNVMWMKEIADNSYGFTGITETDEADIVVSGYSTGNKDSLIVSAYNSSGTEKWRKAFYDDVYNHGSSQIVSLSNSNLLIYNASINPFSSNNQGIQRLLLDKDGIKISGGVWQSQESCVDLIRTSASDIVGIFNMPPVPFKIRDMGENGTGNNTGSVNRQIVLCRAVKETPNGDLLCCGTDYAMSGPIDRKGFVARFSSGLASLDYDLYTTTLDFNNIIATNFGFIAVSASTSGYVYITGCDHSGTILWEKKCPKIPGTTESVNNIFTSGSYFVMIGNSSENNFFVMGVDEDGNIHP